MKHHKCQLRNLTKRISDINPLQLKIPKGSLKIPKGLKKLKNISKKFIFFSFRNDLFCIKMLPDQAPLRVAAAFFSEQAYFI